MLIEVHNKVITEPGTLNPAFFTENDGVGCCTDNEYYIHDSVIDMSNTTCDEALSFTRGAWGRVERCTIIGAGKLVLCGSGEPEYRHVTQGKSVVFEDCVFADFCRRGPEVQDGMVAYLLRCFVWSWSDPKHFDVRAFGAWAHGGGHIFARDSVFVAPHHLPFLLSLKDRIAHIGQAVKDDGLRALLRRRTYVAGPRRALTRGPGGYVTRQHCYVGKGLVVDAEDPRPMPRSEAERMAQARYASQVIPI